MFCIEVIALLIHHTVIVQEAWDLARRISCPTSEKSNGKTVYFKPITVDMLDVVSVSAEPGTIDCWMDIQRGQYPRVSKKCVCARARVLATSHIIGMFQHNPMPHYII